MGLLQSGVGLPGQADDLLATQRGNSDGHGKRLKQQSSQS